MFSSPDVAVGGPRAQRLAETIDRLFHLNARTNLQNVLAKILPQELAQVLAHFPSDEVREILFAVPDPAAAALVLKDLPDTLQQSILAESEPASLVPILERLPPDARADVIGGVVPELASRFLALLNAESQREVTDLLQYAPETAGGLMTSHFFALSERTSVGEAIAAVRGLASYEMVFYLYVVDDLGRLTGVSSLRQLLLADQDATLVEMMNPRVVKVSTETDQDAVADLVAKYRLLALPVVDDVGVLVGLITVDDVIDVLEKEKTDHILRTAGTSGSELEARGPLDVFRVRLPWLLVTFACGAAASAIVHLFDESLTRALAIIAFVPLVLGLTGNFGTIVATVAARNLAAGTGGPAPVLANLWRELKAGLLSGGAYGLLGFAVAWGISRELVLGETVGLSILINMVGAAAIAALLPSLFKRAGADPSMATGPFITPVVDVLGVTVYLLTASAMQALLGA